jgi:fructose-bisphosphate aldolase, class II
MNLKSYLVKARKEGWAMGQFNFSTLDQLKAIIESSVETKSPIIVGTSLNESLFFGLEEASLLVSFYRKKYKLPVFLNLDHGRDVDLVKKAISVGYDMVHFDGSKTDIRDNIKNTKKVTEYAHKRKVLVEGEVGFIPGKSIDHEKKEVLPESEKISIDEVLSFVKETSVDLLALPFGNVHGVYSTMPKLNFKLIEESSEKTKKFLVLHGGSGISSSEIKKTIKMGIVKININTEIRMAWKESLQKSIKSNESAPYFLLSDSKEKIIEKVKEKNTIFNSLNKKI